MSLNLGLSHTGHCRGTLTRIKARMSDPGGRLGIDMSVDGFQSGWSIDTTLDLSDLTRSTGLQTTSIIAPTSKIRGLLKLSHIITCLNKARGRKKLRPRAVGE